MQRLVKIDAMGIGLLDPPAQGRPPQLLKKV
jgi:hypothetical protein